MWNEDFLIAGDWSLDLPVDRLGSAFGDTKADGCHGGNNHLSLQLQDAVEHVPSQSPSRNEDILGLEWMESADLCSYLEVLGGSSHDKLLPLEASLIEYTSSIAPDEPLTFDDSLTGSEQRVKEESSHFLEECSSGSLVVKATFDSFLSPPSSPEQVAPIIKIEPECTKKNEQIDKVKVVSSVSFELFDKNLTKIADIEQTPVYDGLDFMSSFDTAETVVTFDSAQDLLGSPLSADEIESMLSGSTPSSPSSTIGSCSSIIESSPELYKVISTSSIGDSRFSPYSKSKPSKQSKVTSKSRAPAEPVPDHVIMEQLSKKDRKKLQNKNAAIRYRMKKKEEALDIRSEEQILEEKNMELKTKVDDLQREIRYMKNLMEDVCRAKGLI